MRHIRSKIVFVSVVALTSSALAQGGPKEERGGIIGGIMGSVVGSMIPGGSAVGSVISSQSGTVGSLIGSSIGAQLDAEDRAALAEATLAAFQTGKTRSFTGAKSHAKVVVKITKTTKDESGRMCRTGLQTISFEDGRKSSDSVSGCKGAKGDWEV